MVDRTSTVDSKLERVGGGGSSKVGDDDERKHHRPSQEPNGEHGERQPDEAVAPKM
jgi:hypothetical protein